jgi:hypothetical protein
MTNIFSASLAPWRLCAPLAVLIVFAASTSAAPPHLAKQGDATQLVVDDKPFLVVGGELGNSAATTLESMEPIWPRLVDLHLNTVLVPAYWHLIEPREGEFDFALVDGLIEAARQHNLRLVFLWFGSWKNSMSCYAPEWVKVNQDRFPRSLGSDGRGIEILSPFSEENVTADAKAFAALMKHLKKVDGDQHTVIMVQVENEIGIIPEARDHSPEATKLFRGQVPKELMDYVVAHKKDLMPEFRAVWEKAGGKTSGTWEEVFGPGVGTEEIFMAWHFGRFTNRVAAAGKAEYELPMFVNAALMRPGYAPGDYPSAGPLPHLMDVWRAAAPSIDMLSPDIYFPNFVEWCDKFNRGGNPMFIPEAVRGSKSAANVFYAIGQCNAIGLCPFAIDHLKNPSEQPLQQSFALVRQLAPQVLKHQGDGSMVGVVPNVPFEGTPIPESQRVELGDYAFNVRFEKPAEVKPTPGLDPGEWISGGLIIQEGPNEFLIAGTGMIVTFEPAGDAATKEKAGIASVELGDFVDGEWKVRRHFSGDETHQGRHVRIPPGEYNVQRVKLYRYR